MLRQRRTFSYLIRSPTSKKRYYTNEKKQSKPSTDISKMLLILKPTLTKAFRDFTTIFEIFDNNGDGVLQKKEWLQFCLGKDNYKTVIRKKKRQISQQYKKYELEPNKTSKNSKNKNRRRSSKKINKENEILFDILSQEFDQIDINQDGVIDRFEFCFYFMTQELDVSWQTMEIQYRIGLYSSLLKTLGPIDAKIIPVLTEEKLEERKFHPPSIQSKLQLISQFMDDNFNGDFKVMSLVGKHQEINAFEILTWFIALNYDPLQSSSTFKTTKNSLRKAMRLRSAFVVKTQHHF